MASLNKVQLIGNLGRDPEVRYSSDGSLAICTFSLATSRMMKNPNTGETSEETEWHRVVFFGKQAETIQKYMHKGSQMYVEGRLRTRKYEKDGVTHYTTEIMGERSLFLSSRGGTGTTDAYDDYPEVRGFTGSSAAPKDTSGFEKSPTPRTTTPPASTTPPSSSAPQKEDPFPEEDEDIPF
ncbi:MAG: single-stranded DNA-binding protein [Burkholderiales bacterium]|nr:single-stranded DNA-binding protein [Burkholderiales bacterium]